MAAAKTHPKSSIDAEGRKTCTLCKKRKLIAEFTPLKDNPGSFASRCKVCNNMLHREYRLRHPDKANGALRKARLKRDYGMTLEQFQEILLAQGGGCAICGTKKPKGFGEQFHVDHCHESGRVRGLLCSNCNRGLGLFGDETARLRLAIQYLERHGEQR